MPLTTESHVDVLIVGAGPAGLMAATWMSRCGIKTRIIDKKSGKIYHGQADGLQSRTLEIFDSFGLIDGIWRQSNHMLEMCMWSPNKEGVIHRSSIVVDTPPGISRYQQATLHQGHIEKFLIASLKEHADIEVERSVQPESMVIDEDKVDDDEAYPISIRLKHLGEQEVADPDISNGLHRSNLFGNGDDGKAMVEDRSDSSHYETVRAKYVIGCDGAHSWVRNDLGFKLIGEQTDYIWGVLDIVPITDFPDIRKRGAIHSADSGSIMIIPREGKLVRLYCQIMEVPNGGRIDRSAINPEMILKQAQKIFAPYKLSYKHCDWFTAYQIGQRVGSDFSFKNRVFLAGDAVHTHSPKAGQGMNVSMQDTYNLGWKIASVINGTASRSILSTYEAERKKVAQDLIDFDHKFSRLFSGRPARDENDKEGVSMEAFRAAYENGNWFTSGISVTYAPSLIISNNSDTEEEVSRPEVNGNSRKRIVAKQHLATSIPLGARMPSFKVLNHSDARPWHLQEILKSDGRWRLVIFAGDIKDPKQNERVQTLGTRLADPKSFLARFTPRSKPIDSVIEVLTVHSANPHETEIFDFPEIFRPYSEKDGWDYWKIYVDHQSYHEGHGHAYQNYGVDPQRGCLVVLRPDQHVSYIGELEDVEQVDSFFSAFLETAHRD